MSAKLKDLIRAVRDAKTAAGERAVIAKECANIRTAFKEGEVTHRTRNVSKLIYIHLLGYPTEFGQMECINLMASEVFAEKKVGYLALSLLVDEQHEVLTLVENHFKRDLEKSNEHVQGLALVAIANMAGEDMARDLGNEVAEMLTENQRPNLKKKACLAALRIIRRVPSLLPSFLDRLTSVMEEKNHGALICSLAVVIEGLRMEEGQPYLEDFTNRCLPRTIHLLKSLIFSKNANEHDINMTADPFLQVKLLQFLRVMGTGNLVASSTMNDVLANVATNTDRKLLCGCAILYECVNTIISIEADLELRELAVKVLGDFLVTRDNNIRYVALNTLLKVVAKDAQAVRRHNNTIVECIKDPDVSIKKRALELCYSLVNASNVRLLLPDLISYLSFVGNNTEDLTAKICTASERFAPNPQWHISTLIKVMTLSSTHFPESAMNRLMSLITQADAELQSTSVAKLWEVIDVPIDANLLQQTATLQVGVWCVGELAEILYNYQVQSDPSFTPESIVVQITAILQGTSITTIKQYCLTALLKLAVRFPTVKLLVLPTFEAYQSSLELELQQRAWEYLQMLSSDDTTVAESAAARMPNIITKTDDVLSDTEAPADPNEDVAPAAPAPAATAAPAVESLIGGEVGSGAKSGAGFLDDIFSAPSTGQQGTAQPQPSSQAQTGGGGGGLNLDDIFGGGGAANGAAPAPVQQPTPQQPVTGGLPADPFSMPPQQPQQQPPQPQPSHIPQGQVLATVNAFQNQHLSITMTAVRRNPASQHDVTVVAEMRNISGAPIGGVAMLAAAAKSATLQLLPLQQDSMPPGGSVIQEMSVNNNNNGSNGMKPIALKIRLSYQSMQGPQNEEFTVTGLPNTC